mgnify:CR=1 FL=1
MLLIIGSWYLLVVFQRYNEKTDKNQNQSNLPFENRSISQSYDISKIYLLVLFLFIFLGYKASRFLIREHSFLVGGVGRRNSGEGHKLFACPKREGHHKFGTPKRCVTINFTTSRGRVTFFNKNIKGGLRDFTFMLIGIPPAHPRF